VVVLPAPLTPSKAKHSPFSTPNDNFSTARNGLAHWQPLVIE